ncbi:hypothetical protein [Ekhidna sp.]|uniref:DUF3108 domain-containing protein n=1 Tax=Ekhidna sp. TaxID=2608089 RepID=UPI003CCC464C
MKKSILFIIKTALPVFLIAQIDSVNTTNNQLKIDQLNEGQATYLVYLQDSISGPKYGIEVWDRMIKKIDDSYSFKWNRYAASGSRYSYEIAASANEFSPIEERVNERIVKAGDVNIRKKHFIYSGDKIFTNSDTTMHTMEPFELAALDNSFNWEMDLETLSMLPINQGKSYAINFYHPGSKTEPAYYLFEVIRSETLSFNDVAFECWVLKVEYSPNQSSEFWVDKKTHRVMKMKEFFYGRYRYKVLAI